MQEATSPQSTDSSPPQKTPSQERALSQTRPSALFMRLADYNAWINQGLFAAAAKLDDATLSADSGTFFPTILHTLNHILVCDTLWLQRFAGHRTEFVSLAGVRALPRPKSLEQIIYADIDYLWLARQRMDLTISAFCAELRDADLSHSLRFVTMNGTPAQMCFAALLQHFFNHQTHHRGQVSALLTQHGADMGVTDMLALIPDTHTTPVQGQIGAVDLP